MTTPKFDLLNFLAAATLFAAIGALLGALAWDYFAELIRNSKDN